jgi:signal transduction histidine kinase
MPALLTISLDSMDSTDELQHRPETREFGTYKQQSLQELLESYESYRKLIAYEIHDGVVQCLTGALMNLDASLEALGKSVPEKARVGFERTRRLLRQGIAEGRCLINGLSPTILDDYGLVAAVDHLIAESRCAKTTIEWSHTGDFDHLPLPLETAVYRVIQEGVTNALRHSKSNKIGVVLTSANGEVQVIVEDCGRGFDVHKVDGSRLGLQGIRERAKLFGGHAKIVSVPGRGTLITATFSAKGKRTWITHPEE